jgi:hypothetical protein
VRGHPFRTRSKDAKFLAKLADGRSVNSACKAAGYVRRSVYDQRKIDPEFAEAWDDAYEQGSDKLEDDTADAAEQNDILKMFLLKARRPDKYRDNSKIDLNADVTVRGQLEDAAQRATEVHALRPKS